MATNEQPMTGERLARLAARIENIRHMQQVGPRNLSDMEHWQLQAIAVAYADDVSDLLAEIGRLRAREQALAAENAAMLPIVEAVAGEMAVYWNRDLHRFCCHRCDALPTLNMNQIEHESDCRYVQAQQFVAAHPAKTGTHAVSTERPVLRAVISYYCGRDDHLHCNALASGCMCSCHAPQPPESEGE